MYRALHCRLQGEGQNKYLLVVLLSRVVDLGGLELRVDGPAALRGYIGSSGMRGQFGLSCTRWCWCI